jgi:hypothetical protein
MKEIQLRPLGVDLSEIEYIKDSNRNIVGFFGYPHQENTRVRVSLAHQEEINRYNARPAFVFETGTSGAPALGTIRVHGSGMKYLQLKGKKSRCRQPRLIYQFISPIGTDVVNSKR